MKLVCPACGAACSAEAWTSDVDARQVMKIVAELPESVSRRAIAYLALFRPMGGKGLRWSTVLKHLAELDRQVREPFVQWEQRPARPNESRFWGQAMERLIEVPPKKLPLKSHGYLRAMVYEVADEADKSSEKTRNQAEASGRLQDREQRVNAEPERISFERMREIREEKLGKRIV
jgi:hypothetical protein